MNKTYLIDEKKAQFLRKLKTVANELDKTLVELNDQYLKTNDKNVLLLIKDAKEKRDEIWLKHGV